MAQNFKKRFAISLDKVGMCTSVICMLHCISIPLFFLFGFDTALRLVEQEWMELTIIAFALIIGITSFLGGYLSHRQHFVPVLFVAGFLLLLNGEAVGEDWVSLSLSLSGALVIIYAHFQNLRLKRRAIAL